MNKRVIQIVVVVAAVAITGYLYSLNPVRLKTTEKSGHNNGGVSGSAAKAEVAVTADMVSATAKTVIGPGLSAEINNLEKQLKSASGKEKLELERQLAHAWDDVNQPAPAAFYYLDLARSSNQFADWLDAGTRFNDAYLAAQDSSLQAGMVLNSTEAFKNATRLQPNNLDAKAGLGVAFVNGGAQSPMEGISLLLEVVKQDPQNWNANFHLGLFSMKSGQFEKAVARFKTLTTLKPDVRPWFYLAEAYKQLGQKQEAIAAYQKCKELVPDPEFGKRIDNYINELKN